MNSNRPFVVPKGGEMMIYPILETKMFQRGIKQKAVARALGISTRSLYNKLKGIVPFTWPEVCILQKDFFPDVSKECLFDRQDTGQDSKLV